MRCGGGEEWPPGFEMVGTGTTFTLTLAGDSIAVRDIVTMQLPPVADGFSCTGTWSGSTLACVLPTGTSCTQPTVSNVPFGVVVSGTNPNSGSALADGQIWAGEWPGVPPTNLSAVCAQ